MGAARYAGEVDSGRGDEEVKSATGGSPSAGRLDLVLPILGIGPVPLRQVQIDTGLTAPRLLAGIDVLGSQRVPALAVGLPGVFGSGSFSPQDVDSHRDGFEVIWSHASADPAQMVDGHALGDGADVDLIGGAMGENLLGFNGDPPIPRQVFAPGWQPDATIALSGEASCPQPVVATLVRPLVNLLA